MPELLGKEMGRRRLLPTETGSEDVQHPFCCVSDCLLMTGTCRHILIPSNEFNEKAILLSSTKKKHFIECNEK
jgi:hypothetical protein